MPATGSRSAALHGLRTSSGSRSPRFALLMAAGALWRIVPRRAGVAVRTAHGRLRSLLALAGARVLAWVGVDPGLGRAASRPVKAARAQAGAPAASSRARSTRPPTALTKATIRAAGARRPPWASRGRRLGRVVVPRLGPPHRRGRGDPVTTISPVDPATTGSRRFPALGGTVAIAGHRTTYLQPFRHIDDLRAGRPHLRRRCRTRPFATSSTRIASSTTATGRSSVAPVRAARPHRVPPALLRVAALRRLRTPRGDRSPPQSRRPTALGDDRAERPERGAGRVHAPVGLLVRVEPDDGVDLREPACQARRPCARIQAALVASDLGRRRPRRSSAASGRRSPRRAGAKISAKDCHRLHERAVPQL